MLTVPEAARRVGRDPETVRRWIRAGKLAAWKVGTQHVIDEDDLAPLVGPANLAPPDPDQPAHQRISEALATYRSEHETSSGTATTAETWLPAIVGRIVHEVDPERIILFGSRGRGDARRDSDFDLLVVLDAISDRRATRLDIRRVLDDLPIAKDIIVATTDEVDGGHGRPRGVLHWALTEGRALYQRV